jgi:outer membrane lipoprotein-sorting protein
LHVSFLQTRRLPTIKREQTQPGELWYAAPDQFRWQLGEPPQIIALRQGEQALVLQPQKKRGQRLDAATGQRGTEYLMMMRHPLAADRTEFLQKFELKSLQTRDGKLLLDLLPRDTGARQHLRSMQLNVDPPSGILERMELHFRDGASLITQTTKVIVNGGTVPGVFQMDVTDYQIKE